MEIVIKAYPKAVRREEIDRATGYARSTRDTYIQKSISRKILDAIGHGEVRAAEVLFEGD